jgi:hypothetical protein
VSTCQIVCVNANIYIYIDLLINRVCQHVKLCVNAKLNKCLLNKCLVNLV